ncbi:hypothetical protein WL76_22935 [Burkholderia ubonensis]|uniref:hypothetical protein n=1 Tax=Burkholderia ubonensis TaxID=101571 RepID=UPI00075F2036|nr:hypothetical protein [Burkholderia ubonensis]KWE48874.1 hypothetical protein WL76_22935 [Burkholderia ubonensis]
MRKFQSIDALFDPEIVSADIESCKDNHPLLDCALGYLAVEPRESIFIDNNPNNLTIPKELGMGAIFHGDERNDIDN